jgi:uncharacterized protein (TIGR00290 family)
MPQLKTFMNWSGGKDSSLALYHALQADTINPGCLFTTVNSVHNRISMHGVRRELLIEQAASIELPLFTAELPEQPGMIEYEEEMDKRLKFLKEQGYSDAIFGDIFLEDLKNYREEQFAKYEIKCHFPLWKKDTTELLDEFLQLGFKAVVVCVNGQHLDKSFCGRMINNSFLKDLPASVDPCGENGEYHSFVFDGPIFNYPIKFEVGELVSKKYKMPSDKKDNCFTTDELSFNEFYFQDLISV